MERYWPVCIGTLRTSYRDYPVYVIKDSRERQYVQGVKGTLKEIEYLAAYLNKRESRKKEVKQCTA